MHTCMPEITDVLCSLQVQNMLPGQSLNYSPPAQTQKIDLDGGTRWLVRPPDVLAEAGSEVQRQLPSPEIVLLTHICCWLIGMHPIKPWAVQLRVLLQFGACFPGAHA